MAAHIASLGSFWCPWGIASHRIPEIGTFAFLTILPPQGGPDNGMAFFPPDAAQLLRVAREVACGHNARLTTCPTAIICPLNHNLQFFSPKVRKNCRWASNGQNITVGQVARRGFAQSLLVMYVAKKLGGKVSRNTRFMSSAKSDFLLDLYSF